jgi:hypothetical protein
MACAVELSLKRHLADIEADDARSALVDAEALDIQEGIDAIIDGDFLACAIDSARQCLERAVEFFDRESESIEGLLIAISECGDIDLSIDTIRKELRALAYQQATVKADEKIQKMIDSEGCYER